MDEYTRECVVIVVERHLNQEDVLATVFDLFIDRGVPEYLTDSTKAIIHPSK